jgi:hypothetical protein
MLKALDSRRYEQFVTDFTTLLQRGPTRRAGAQPPVLAVAPELIARRHRKVRRLARAIDEDAPPEEYHKLRIQAKRLRYAVQFLGDLYGRPARELVRRLVLLQDLLGLHQDATVAVAHLRELAGASRRKLPPATIFVMGLIAGRYQREAAELRRRFPKTYRQFRGRPWRALRAIMERKRPAEERPLVKEHRRAGNDTLSLTDEERPRTGRGSSAHSAGRALEGVSGNHGGATEAASGEEGSSAATANQSDD